MSEEDREAMRTKRQQWAGRVREWRASGLTAREYAAGAGVNASTLQHWAWRLRNEEDSVVASRGAPDTPAFVEVVAPALEDQRLEVEIGKALRLRIPAGFDAGGLEDVLTVLVRIGATR